MKLMKGSKSKEIDLSPEAIVERMNEARKKYRNSQSRSRIYVILVAAYRTFRAACIQKEPRKTERALARHLGKPASSSLIQLLVEISLGKVDRRQVYKWNELFGLALTKKIHSRFFEKEVVAAGGSMKPCVNGS
jgi:hypothetical protein